MRRETQRVDLHPGSPGGARVFSTTHWSVVVRAADAKSPDGRAALEELCLAYWRPVYWFARRRVPSAADAEDLTQGFFEDLLSRNAIAHADPQRGRFRTFLLTALVNFHSHQWVRQRRLKRGGQQTIVSIDALRGAESEYGAEPVNDESPEKLFDRSWAVTLLGRVFESVHHEYAAAGKGKLCEALASGLWGGGGERSYAAIASELGTTEGAVKVAAHRFRRRVAERLRVEVAQTVLSEEEVQEEIRNLMAAVGR